MDMYARYELTRGILPCIIFFNEHLSELHQGHIKQGPNAESPFRDRTCRTLAKCNKAQNIS